MITKTSLFSKGIYKSTVKRFLWGSILYTVLLFIITILPILLKISAHMYYYIDRRDLLLAGSIQNTLSLAMIVSVVTGLLVFRFMHSKKVTVFTHSLPIARTGNYISTVLAAFTLMALPVIFNTVILIVMSMCGFGALFTVGSCIKWMLLNLFALFIMFSCTCLVASLTGNSWAMVVLNIFIHVFLTIIATAMDMAASRFLYGHPGGSVLAELVSEKSFPNIITLVADYYMLKETVSVSTFVVPLVISAVFYGVAFLLYKKRNFEKTEDVAGFCWLEPVFKFIVTFTGTLAAYSLFFGMMWGEHSTVFWIMTLFISAVIYFACEMLLKKTFRVFKSYKGFLCIVAVFAVFAVLLINTSFFGYETRVPDSKDVVSVSINDLPYFDEYGENPKTADDDESIRNAIEIHKDIIKNQKEYEKRILYIGNQNIFIEYELKNGRKLTRGYFVPESVFAEAMEKMYSNESYKVATHPIFDEITEINSLELWGNDGVVIEEGGKELIECIRKDVKELGYQELQSKDRVIALEFYYANELHGKIYYDNYSMEINFNFKNTIKWLKDNGYWETLQYINEGEFYISEDLDFIRFEDEKIIEMSDERKANLIKLQGEEAEGLVKYLNETLCDEENGGKIYCILHKAPETDYATKIAYISQAQLDEIIK